MRARSGAWRAAFPSRRKPFVPGRRTAVRTIRNRPGQTCSLACTGKGAAGNWEVEPTERNARRCFGELGPVCQRVEPGWADDAGIARNGRSVAGSASATWRKHIGASLASRAARREISETNSSAKRPTRGKQRSRRPCKAINVVNFALLNCGCARSDTRSASRKASTYLHARGCTAGGARVRSRRGPWIELRVIRSVGTGGTMESVVEFHSGSVSSDGRCLDIDSERRFPRSLSRARSRSSRRTARNRL